MLIFILAIIIYSLDINILQALAIVKTITKIIVAKNNIFHAKTKNYKLNKKIEILNILIYFLYN